MAKKNKKNKKNTFGAKVDKGIGTVKYLTSKETVTDFAKKNKNIFIAIAATLGFVALNKAGKKIKARKK
jgi:hypothetical protein